MSCCILTLTFRRLASLHMAWRNMLTPASLLILVALALITPIVNATPVKPSTYVWPRAENGGPSLNEVLANERNGERYRAQDLNSSPNTSNRN